MSDQFWPYLSEDAKFWAKKLVELNNDLRINALDIWVVDDGEVLLPNSEHWNYLKGDQNYTQEDLWHAINQLQQAQLISIRGEKQQYQANYTVAFGPQLRAAVGNEFRPLRQFSDSISIDEIADRIAQRVTPEVLTAVARLDNDLHFALAELRDALKNDPDTSARASKVREFFRNISDTASVASLGQIALLLVSSI